MFSFRRVYNGLFFALIISIPLNLFKSFPTGHEFLNGLRIDYLIPKVYLSELLAIGIIAGGFLSWARSQNHAQKISNKPWTLALIGSTVLLWLAQFQSPLPLIGMISLAQLMITVLLMLSLSIHRRYISKFVVVCAAGISLVWQLILATHQWFFQQSLLPFFVSGEPEYSWSIFLAKSNLLGSEKILPYGSTAHPNVLGGVAAIYGLGVYLYWLRLATGHTTNRRLIWLTISGIIVLISVYLCLVTESIAALCTFFGGSLLILIGWFIALNVGEKNFVYPLIKRWQWYLLALLMGIIVSSSLWILAPRLPENQSILRRITLLDASRKALTQSPLTGVGGSQFVYWLNQTPMGEKLAPFIQPVHAAPLLFLVDYGAIGLFSMLALAIAFPHGWFARKLPLFWLCLIPIIFTDHYLFSLVPGLLLLAVVPSLWNVESIEN